MSRVREFGDLRNSRESKRDEPKLSYVSQANFYTPKQEFDKQSHASSTHSHYICLNCVNQNMSEQKKRDFRDRDTMEKSRYDQLEKSRRVYDEHLRDSIQKKHEQEKRKLLEYNRKMIDEHNLARSKEKFAIQLERERQLALRKQNDSLIERDSIERQRKKKQLRDSIQKQIQDKNQTKLRQQMDDRYQKYPENQGYDGLEIAKRKQDEYKQGLIDQINANEQRKRRAQEQKRNTQKASFALTQLAEERARQALAQQNKRRVKFQQEIKQMAKAGQQRKIAQQLKIEQDRIQALINQQFQEKQLKQNQKLKAQQTYKYKFDIQKQIDEKKRQRQNERLRDKYSITNYLNMSIEEIEKRLCDSCEKEYPKKLMTRVKK